MILSSDEFIAAIGNVIVAKTPYNVLENRTEKTSRSVQQGYNLFEIALGNRKRKNTEITLTDTTLNDWLLWQASQSITRLIERIAEGENEDGTR